MSNQVNFFAKWKAENTSARLGYGIHTPVVIKKVDTTPRKKQDGSIMKVAMFITYTQVDANRMPVAEIEEFIFWPKHDGKLDPKDAVMRYMNHLSEILEPWYPMDQINQVLDPFTPLNLTTMEEFDKMARTKKGMTTIIDEVNKIFSTVMAPLTGIQSEYQYRLKVTYQEDGRGVEIPPYDFIEAASVPKEESKLKMTARDSRAQTEAEKPKASTNLGAGGANIPPTPGTPMGANIPGMPNQSVAPSATPQYSSPQQTTNPVVTQMQQAAAAPAQQPAPAQQAMPTQQAAPAQQAAPSLPFLNNGN